MTTEPAAAPVLAESEALTDWSVVGVILAMAVVLAVIVNMLSGPSAWQMSRALQTSVATDAQGWAFNRYDKDSLTGFKILQHPAHNEYIVRGDYTFDGGTQGWVMARMIDGKVQCLQYWDRDFCRIVDASLAVSDQSNGSGAASPASDDSGEGLINCLFNHGIVGELCKQGGIGLDADHGDDHPDATPPEPTPEPTSEPTQEQPEPQNGGGSGESDN